VVGTEDDLRPFLLNSSKTLGGVHRRDDHPRRKVQKVRGEDGSARGQSRSAVNAPSTRSPIFAVPRIRAPSTFAVTRMTTALPPSVASKVKAMSWSSMVPRTCD